MNMPTEAQRAAQLAAVELEITQERAALAAARIHFTHRVNGTYTISTDIDYSLDRDDELSLQIGEMQISMGYDGGRQLLHSLLATLYGDCYAAAMLTLLDRLPETQFNTRSMTGESSEHAEQARGAVRALWHAAHTFRHLWPIRRGSFDDRLWGVTPPPGITPLPLADPDELYEPPAQPPEFAAFLNAPPPPKPRALPRRKR